MISWVLARVYFALGMITMFIPVLAGRPDTSNIFIPGGIILGLIGIMLMGLKEKKKRKQNDNILDDGEF